MINASLCAELIHCGSIGALIRCTPALCTTGHELSSSTFRRTMAYRQKLCPKTTKHERVHSFSVTHTNPGTDELLFCLYLYVSFEPQISSPHNCRPCTAPKVCSSTICIFDDETVKGNRPDTWPKQVVIWENLHNTKSQIRSERLIQSSMTETTNMIN